MAKVATTKTSAKRYRVSGGTGVKSKSVSSGNNGMAAAILSSGGVFVTDKKMKR